jgi:hypothetical protein
VLAITARDAMLIHSAMSRIKRAWVVAGDSPALMAALEKLFAVR